MKTFVILLMLVNLATAEQSTFRDVRLAHADGTLTNSTLDFDDQTKVVIVRGSDVVVATIPYNQIDQLSYEFTKQHRWKPGLIVGVLSPGTGIIVALTRSRNHWLDIDFHDKEAAKTIVLRLNKRTFQQVCDAAKTHTGKDVTILGRTNAKSIKDKTNH